MKNLSMIGRTANTGLTYSEDDPVTRSIGVALSELEAIFNEIHDKWSEDD